MDEEYKKLLEENLVLNKENNQMLNKLVLYQKWNQIYKIAYWAIIILGTIGAFYFIQPLLGNLFSVYTGGASTPTVNSLNDLKNLGTNNDVKDLLKSLNGN